MFCEGLVKEGKLRPTEFDEVMVNLKSCKAADVKSFAESSGRTKGTLLDAYKDSLSKREKVISFAEHATHTSASTIPAGSKTAVERVAYSFAEKYVQDHKGAGPHEAWSAFALEKPEEYQTFLATFK